MLETPESKHARAHVWSADVWQCDTHAYVHNDVQINDSHAPFKMNVTFGPLYMFTNLTAKYDIAFEPFQRHSLQ